MDRVVIIGNGAAANSAAETIRRNDSSIPVLMIARERLPLYSACALPDSLSGWVKRERVFLKSMQDYTNMDIDIRLGGEVDRIDPGSGRLGLEGEDIGFSRLILATGSRPVIPPVPGSTLKGNHVVKSVNDIDAIEASHPRQAVVVGSGNIGIETAEALQIRGCEVTVVEMMERIFPRIFDAEPARRIAQILEQHGIRLLTGEKVMEVCGSGRVEGLVTDQQKLDCDTVIWAAGVKQNVELARAAGLEIGALGGIKVDEHMKTSADNVYACGDCIESIDMLTGQPCLSLLWPNAKRQGEIAGLNAAGIAAEYEGAVSLVVEDIYGTTALAMGKTGSELSGDDCTILEGESRDEYWRIVIQDDRIMGMQALNVAKGTGAVMALMKKRITLSEYRAAMTDPLEIRALGWYLPARRFLL